MKSKYAILFIILLASWAMTVFLTLPKVYGISRTDKSSIGATAHNIKQTISTTDFLNVQKEEKIDNQNESTSSILKYVIDESIKYGINPQISECIVSHESQWNSQKAGDDNNSRGLWQISKIYHPEVSSVVAYSSTSSTIWSLKWIKKGYIRQWTTYSRYCRDIPVFIK